MKCFILDTNILMSSPNCIVELSEQGDGSNKIILLTCVLEELDNLKSNFSVGFKARQAIKSIDDNMDLLDLMAVESRLDKFEDVERVFDLVNIKDSNPNIDNIILTASCGISSARSDVEFVLLSNDICMGIKCRLMCKGRGITNLTHESYKSLNSQSIDKEGLPEFKLHEDHFAELMQGDSLKALDLGEQDYFIASIEGYSKKYLFKNDGDEVILLNKPIECFGITSRNLEQAAALHAMLDPTKDLVILNGPQGTGKTFCAVAAALELSQRDFNQVLLIRPAIGKKKHGLGFLPGTEQEKLAPYMLPFKQAMNELINPTKDLKEATFDVACNQFNVHVQSMEYIRGTSFKNTLMLIDESQNLSAEDVLDVITRAGEGTKIIMIGHVGQIDDDDLSESDNGLAHAINKMKPYEGYCFIPLVKVERSRLAAAAVDLM